MHHGFCNRPKNHANSHPTAEEHGKPLEITEFRFLVILAELDTAITANGNTIQSNHKDKH